MPCAAGNQGVAALLCNSNNDWRANRETELCPDLQSCLLAAFAAAIFLCFRFDSARLLLTCVAYCMLRTQDTAGAVGCRCSCTVTLTCGQVLACATLQTTVGSSQPPGCTLLHCRRHVQALTRHTRNGGYGSVCDSDTAGRLKVIRSPTRQYLRRKIPSLVRSSQMTK